MITLSLLTVCFFAAAWPLLKHPRIRHLLAGAAGSALMALGTTAVGLLTGGFALMPVFSAEAHAAEAALPSDKPLPPAAPAPSSADPEIEATSPDTVVIPPGRPQWVEKEPDYSSDVHTIPVSWGPFKHESEC